MRKEGGKTQCKAKKYNTMISPYKQTMCSKEAKYILTSGVLLFRKKIYMIIKKTN